MASEDAPVSALVRGLKILETFGRRGYSLSLAELAQELALPKSTVYRLLATLAGLGYVIQPVKGGPYSLAPAVLGLGYAVLDGLAVREAALPYLEALFQEVDGNVNLCVLGHAEVIYVARLRQRDVLSLNLGVGSRLPVHNSSPGRVLAAFLPESERRALVRRLKAQAPVRAWLKERGADLGRLLEEVRERGWAVNDGEYLPELFALAAPVFDRRGSVPAAVSVATLKHGRPGAELRGLLLEPVLRCARGVSAALGHRGPVRPPAGD